MQDGDDDKEVWKESLRLLVGLCLAHRGQESEAMWQDRRRGRDVVGEREGEKKPGGSEMKFEGQTFD